MQILVLGGNRFFGRHLVGLLSESGHKVTVANHGSRPNIFRDNVETLLVDRTSEASMTAAFTDREFDVVYDQICNTGEEANIATKVFRNNIGKLIFTSTASVYSTKLNRDESFFNPIEFTSSQHSDNPYQHGKRLAEKTYLDAAFPVTSVRLPVVMGQDDYKLRLHWHIERVLKGEGIYFPDFVALYSFILAEDAAKFLYWIGLKKHHLGAINAASPDPVRMADLMKWIEQYNGRSAVYDGLGTDSNHSPYGILSDCTLSVEKAETLGYEFQLAHKWLPKLVENLCTNSTSWMEPSSGKLV